MTNNGLLIALHMIAMFGGDLFTGNTMTMAIGMCHLMGRNMSFPDLTMFLRMVQSCDSVQSFAPQLAPRLHWKLGGHIVHGLLFWLSGQHVRHSAVSLIPGLCRPC